MQNTLTDGFGAASVDRSRPGDKCPSDDPSRIPDGFESLLEYQRALELSWRIREYRDRQAMSQEQMSRASGVSRTTLSRIEHGKLFPERFLRSKLARYFDIHPEELLLIAPGERYEGYFGPHSNPHPGHPQDRPQDNLHRQEHCEGSRTSG